MANVKALPNLQDLGSPSPAQTLPSEAVLDALKMMLIGAVNGQAIVKVYLQHGDPSSWKSSSAVSRGMFPRGIFLAQLH
jgi:hypothetical protein